ncbi:hypothetical protein EC973_003176 [Apophysomyces ossiformis]|uniref:Mitochondrial cardiolipin hydrolase n=1 Tax=Apophysomyces ossiformis TaxID=679940 RepID=A0A8H7EN69_9FUNG|nr:hypothetical protein EC973_003176 [Apophysomyces ossiformis]
MPSETTLEVSDLKTANFQQLIGKTMASASSLMKDDDLQDIAISRLNYVLSNKSHSPSNTLKTIRTMFETAADACQYDQERHLIRWLQTCVVAAVQMGLQEAVQTTQGSTVTKKAVAVVADKKTKVLSDEAAPKPPAKESKKAEPVKKEKKKPKPIPKSYDDDDDDDDAYVPSDAENLSSNENDAVVPLKPKPKKNGRKKRSDINHVEQVVPDLETGAGPTAVIRSFEIPYSGTTKDKRVLPKGYFARSFFFPSEESFKANIEYDAFLAVLKSARSTIDICVYSLTDDDVADVLIAAKQRNVKIRIITDNQQSAIKGADAKRLQEDYGIPYKTDNTSGYMHNKFAVVDNATLINGSFNWSKGARFKNRENITVTNLPELIKEFNRQFEALWEEF